MNLASLLSGAVAESSARSRVDGAPRGRSEEGRGGANEFTSVLSELKGASGRVSDDLNASTSTTETKGEASARRSKSDGDPPEASAAPVSIATSLAAMTAPIVDANWARFPERPAAGAGASESKADSSASDRSTEVVALLLPSDSGEGAPRRLDTASVLDKSSASDKAYSARDETSAPVDAQTTRSQTVDWSPQSAAILSNLVDGSSVAPVASAAARLGSWKGAGRAEISPSAGAKDEVRNRALIAGSRDARGVVAESDAPPNPSAEPELSADQENSSDEVAETIGKIKIQSLETHLPIALSDLLVPQARSMLGLDESRGSQKTADAAAPAKTPASTDAPRKIGGATKLLTIELEPDSLGVVVVKMKLSHTGIDMKISVGSAEALRTLDATRDDLVDAMQSTGCAVDACTIQIAAPAADSSQAAMDDGSRYTPSDGAGRQREQQVGGEGASNGGRSGYPQQESGSGSNGVAPDVSPRRSADLAGGVYL